jgi:competence ComEA-like helix-hairpin-helix protein
MTRRGNASSRDREVGHRYRSLVVYSRKYWLYYNEPMAWRSPAIRALVSCLFFTFLLFTVVSTGAAKKPPLKPVNINTATSEELQQVPGIGPVTAEKILQMRKSYGAFKSVDDLLAIRGIGKKRLDKMRKYLTVGKPAAANKAPPPKAQSKEPDSPTEQPPPSN